MLTPKADTSGGGKYCYGFGLSQEDGKRVVGHDGGAPGMNGQLDIRRDRRYVVAALANLDPPSAGRVANFINLRLP